MKKNMYKGISKVSPIILPEVPTNPIMFEKFSLNVSPKFMFLLINSDLSVDFN